MALRRIGDIRHEFLRDYDIDVTNDAIRRYEKAGMFSASSRGKENNHRAYNEKDTDKVKYALMLTEIGLTPKEVVENNKADIDRRIEAIEKIMTELKRRRN